MKLGVYINPLKLKYKGKILLLLNKLSQLNVDFYLNKEIEKDLESQYQYQSKRVLTKNKELVIVIGGDGTFLRLLQETGNFDTKYVLANIGYIGFLASFDFEELIENLETVLSNQDKFIKISTLQITYGKKKYFAVNDIVIENNGPTKLLKLLVYIDEKKYHKLRASGLILSSPTGSSAVNYSAGGPIVEIGLNTMIYKPVCPQFNSEPSLVFSGNHVITVENINDFPIIFTLDGCKTLKLKSGDKINIQICKNKKFKLLLYKNKNIDDILREKFFGL